MKDGPSEADNALPTSKPTAPEPPTPDSQTQKALSGQGTGVPQPPDPPTPDTQTMNIRESDKNVG